MRNLISAFAVVLVLITAAITAQVFPKTQALNSLEEISLFITQPIVKFGHTLALGFTLPWRYFKSVDFLTQQNQALKTELMRLQGEVNSLKKLAEENEFLRSQLGVKEKLPKPLISANVVGRSLDLSNQGFIIDAGFKAGILVGAPVLGPYGSLVGKVKKVMRFRSVVTPIDSPEFVAAVITEKSGGKGIVRGTLDGNIIMTEIPSTISLIKGEAVFTTEFSSGLPPNQPIGTIESIIEEPNQTTKSASIKEFADISKISTVLISVL